MRAAVAWGFVSALALLFALTATAGRPARKAPLRAGFEARSYRPGQVAVLRITGNATRQAALQLFLAGGASAPGASSSGRDRLFYGVPVSEPRPVQHVHPGSPWLVRIRLGAAWPSGDYVARLHWSGHTDYAPFVLRPERLGGTAVLVVEPTNTWQAYNAMDGDSWYYDPAVHVVDLSRPFAAQDVKGRPLPAGVPKQFLDFELGFLRWYWHSGFKADFVSDDDLEHLHGIGALRRYQLIVFAGHEEYVTSHVYDLIDRYRNAGGNLAFLTANNFFYKVKVSGDTMVGRTKWREHGRPEAALVGAQYVGWDEARYANHPYRVIDAQAARWLFAGTGLHNGSRFGRYGIEIDQPVAGVSPRGTHVIATIPNEFGHKAADMTIYQRGNSTVFDAGALNFGASAHWPGISVLVDNLWEHLSGEQPSTAP
jgi:N,N-dimethylformamidase beta subunit-like, C-terminal